MEIKVMRDEQTYRATLARISSLVDLDPAPGSPEGEELAFLGSMVEAYESKHYSIRSPGPL